MQHRIVSTAAVWHWTNSVGFLVGLNPTGTKSARISVERGTACGGRGAIRQEQLLDLRISLAASSLRCAIPQQRKLWPQKLSSTVAK